MEEQKINELFDQLKSELDFLPEDDAVREGFLFAFKYELIS